MAAPIIQPTQSVLQYLQFQNWQFQPQALNDPITWTCTPLPSGLDFDPSTGLISGASTKPGVYNALIAATNADGTSPALTFVIGIEAASYAAQFDAVDLGWDMGTGKVSCDALFDSVPLLNNGQAPAIPPIAWVKSGDVRMFHIRPTKAGAVLDIAFLTLILVLKEFDGDARIELANKFVRVDTGANTFYRLVMDLTDPNLVGVLGDFFDVNGTNFAALAEIQATYTNALSPSISGAPGTLITTSQNFGLGVQQELS